MNILPIWPLPFICYILSVISSTTITIMMTMMTISVITEIQWKSVRLRLPRPVNDLDANHCFIVHHVM